MKYISCIEIIIYIYSLELCIYLGFGYKLLLFWDYMDVSRKYPV